MIPTIAAIATAAGGGIGIIRVSGPLAPSIGKLLCHPWPQDIKSHQLYFTTFFDKTEPLDQGLVCLMQKPHSYTGEDVLEIHAHGGRVNLQRILQAVLAAGAAPAAPGEFTRRAFLAGKLDLIQAEAIAALIGAQSIHASRQAQRQLSGALGKTISAVRQRILYWLGTIEGSLDFPDLEEDQGLTLESKRELMALQRQLTELSTTFTDTGNVLSQGIEVVLFGKTNAGKSSLVNALCGAERVLVDAEPGTTRDFIEVHTQFQGIPVTLIDTAGERSTATQLEQQGLRLGKQRGLHADIVLIVIDGDVGFAEEELQLFQNTSKQIPCFLVFNKMDKQGYQLPTPSELAKQWSSHGLDPASFGETQLFSCSALCGWGLEAIKQGIIAKLAPHFAEETIVMSARQARLLHQAAERLQSAITGLFSSIPLDVTASELRLAAAALGELTGEEVTESVVDEIFSQFCIGK